MMPEIRETNWFVLSGPAEYGTRLLGASLSRVAFTVIQDGNTLLEAYNIGARRDLGISNPFRAQLKLLREQLELENGFRFPYRTTVIFNGGIGDCLVSVDSVMPKAVGQVREEDEKLIEDAGSHALSTRYRQVFILTKPIEGLDILSGSTRAASESLQHRQRVAYRDSLGYEPVVVSDVSSLEKASRFVANRINLYLRLSSS